jgi:hypothetical protein
VSNLGFIAINIYGNSSQIRLRPAMVGEATYTCLRRWLGNARSERVVLSWLDENWNIELLRAGPQLLRRMDDVMALSKRVKPFDFLSQQLSAPQLDADATLSQIVTNWSACGTPSGQRQLMQMLERALGNRYVVVKPDPTDAKIVFDEFGGGLYADFDVWRACAVGAPIEEQPDRQYGRWVAEAYTDALRSGKPRIDDVDAIVRWPHKGRTRLRYKRIILPMRGTSLADSKLIGGSIIDNRVDLRVGLG